VCDKGGGEGGGKCEGGGKEEIDGRAWGVRRRGRGGGLEREGGVKKTNETAALKITLLRTIISHPPGYHKADHQIGRGTKKKNTKKKTLS